MDGPIPRVVDDDAAWAIAHPLSIETRASRSQLTLT